MADREHLLRLSLDLAAVAEALEWRRLHRVSAGATAHPGDLRRPSAVRPHTGPHARDTAWAMSQENVEIVRRVFEELNRGGPAAVRRAGLLANDVVFDGTGPSPGVGVIRGIDEVTTFFEKDWFAAFPIEDWEIHIEEPIDHEDLVTLTSRQQGRGASSGAGTALTLGNIFTLRKGEIVRIQILRRPEEALEAAGLSE